MSQFVSINPATGKLIQRYRPATRAEIARALDAGGRAQAEWRHTPPKNRAKLLKAVGAGLRANVSSYADLITAEMGKPTAQAKAEIEKCASLCDFYSKHGPALLSDEHIPHSPPNAFITYEPLGLILSIMPWNFPFWQVLRAAGPALLAGNGVLLKHAPSVSGTALALHDLFRSAASAANVGAPPAIFQTLLLPNERVPAVLADRRVQGVTLTGSTRAGRIVGELAGREVKKAVFELGGSDAYIVLPDADLDRAAEICATSRLLNSGQSCVCAKRFIVVSSVRRDFEKRFAARMAARVVGDPREPDTQVGPLARADLRDHLVSQVQASLKKGAKALLGGHPIPGPGCFYAPTVLTDVSPGMPAYEEELFGPVAAVIPARDEHQAIAIANSSPYGLGSALFTRNLGRAKALARRLDAGQVFINDFVRSDPSLPFGGVKQSGHGRELGAFGLREFLNIKTICVTKA